MRPKFLTRYTVYPSVQVTVTESDRAIELVLGQVSIESSEVGEHGRDNML